MKHPPSRDSINVEMASVLEQKGYEGDQHILRLAAPEIASSALAGSFVHLRCDDSLPMRRPMSIMRANPKQGWIDILYKAHGQGTGLLSKKQKGDEISLIGPIGMPFKQSDYRSRPLLIGGGVGIPPMVFLAEHMKKTRKDLQSFVIMGSEVPFPFKTSPSQIMIPGLPEGVIAGMPLLEDWGIASRLCSQQSYPGCFDGMVTDLARTWLQSLNPEQLAEVEIFSCGPTPMLRAVAELADEFALPCQVSLEEYMACAVGGCAGCVVRVNSPSGPAMKRVCVDGPVFEAGSVFY
ncbi:MAG: dihydroorotate dehydrogenase electron transfer subunit [Gammaproteobacteria bacterium]|nr:dihydroorotate dehydrogenase electron transfer subunit [Gammaproteobacteria bacterium]